MPFKSCSSKKIQFVDIVSQYVSLKDEILYTFASIMDSGVFVGGEHLDLFEKNLTEYVGVKHAIGCSNGTDALAFALLGMGIEKGDACIVPTNSFIATANAVVHAGGRPLFVDCDPDHYLIDLNQTEYLLKTGKAKFIIPVHLYGNPCPMEELCSLADRYGAQVLEDNAQAIGASLNGRKTGSFGTAAAVSFYPSKNLGAFGQGGALLTDDDSIAKTARMYIEQGQGSQRHHYDVIGYNGRLHTIQAAILDILLKKLDSFNSARQQVAAWYTERLPEERLQKRIAGSQHVYHLMEYRCESPEERERLMNTCESNDVPVALHYPVPIHQQKAYVDSNALSFPVAERLSETLLSLPMHPNVTCEQVEFICDMIQRT